MANKSSKAKKTSDQPIQPPVPANFGLPFYYASLYNCAMYFAVDPSVVKPYLKGKQVKSAVFDGQALVYFNYQLYTAEFPQAISVVGEIELNIVSYPKVLEGKVPALSLREYIAGEDQTKRYGNIRVHVPCDNPQAIQAGIDLFGEPKFKTTFDISLPSINVPGPEVWKFTCNDPGGPAKPPAKNYIFSAEANLAGLDATLGNVSPTTEYGFNQGRLIGCRWNILEPHNTYFLEAEQAGRVSVSYGTSKHQMRQDMETLIGDAPCIAVQTFASRPAAIQSRAFFADI